MNDKIKEFLEKADEAIRTYHDIREGGMDYDDACDSAEALHDWLIAAIEILEAQTSNK